ncbi:MAG: VWA domain-containing protein, partial [Phycisphaerales bacterium]|nr:VWA domain-containing protein [Phycisphaerales bacterium]
MKNLSGPTACEIVLLLDRSGSMGTLREATILAVNEFLAGQRSATGEAFVSIYQFDHEFASMFEARPAEATPTIGPENYEPRGSTALLDAIGETIERTRLRLDCCGNDARVVLAIMTDGLENASRRFGLRTVRRMLAACQKQGWQVLFLGANIDAVQEAQRLGIAAGRAATFAASAGGISANMRCVGAKIASARSDEHCRAIEFSAEERAS